MTREKNIHNKTKNYSRGVNIRFIRVFVSSESDIVEDVLERCETVR